MARYTPTMEDEVRLWGGATPAAPAQVQLPPEGTDPRKATAPSAGSGTGSKSVTKTPSSSRSSGSSGGSGGGSGYSGPKSSDKNQVASLEALLNSGFKQALDQRIANMQQAYRTADDVLLAGFESRKKNIDELDENNDKAESNASWQNLSNRAREASDILTQAASMGAGETDQLQSQLIALRNWQANQAEVNRAYFDTEASTNSSRNDLYNDSRSARINLSNQHLNDQEQAWATYTNQMSEAATQLGNIRANPYSDSYDKAGSKASWDRMVKTASEAWKNPGVPAEVRDWQGMPSEKRARLNNSILGGDHAINRERRPEGFALDEKPGVPTNDWADEETDPQGKLKKPLKAWA